MVELFAGIGIVAIMLALFKINYDKADEACKGFYELDKKLEILITTLEIKWGEEIIKEAKKKNGTD